MASLAAKDHLGPVVGLKNDIVQAVFSCPHCATEVTVSSWQVRGELPILCARCNSRYQVQGEALLDQNRPMDYFPERWQDGKPVQQAAGYKVMIGLDATQKATALPKDSFTLVMHPELAPKPAPAPAAPASKPAPAPAGPAPKPEVAVTDSGPSTPVPAPVAPDSAPGAPTLAPPSAPPMGGEAV